MSNPTTPFNWQMPTNTDLVTDLPADFEVFGQAVATSMGDLLGGTTGQILAKATNTDMDFTWITNDQGDLTAITAGTGISVTSGTGPIPTVAIDAAATPQLGSANVFTAAQTATRFIVTGSTVATNGMYLSAANTLAFSTNSTAAMQINSTGRLGIGTSPLSFIGILIGGIMGATATESRGIHNGPEFPSGATGTIRNYLSWPSTSAAAFTVTTFTHYAAREVALGAGSAVTNQFGFHVESTMTTATNNFGFYSNLAASSNRWNFYANGTAANYFAGRTGVGVLLTSSAQFGVTNVQGTGEVTVLTRNFAAQTSDSLALQNSAASTVWGVTAAGLMKYISGNTATTVGAAGLASALPALPTGYLKIDIGGTEYKVPYYAA